MELSSYIVVCFSVLISEFVHGWEGNETSYVQPSISEAMLIEDYQCPPWFFYNTATKQCECYHSPSTDSIASCSERGALYGLYLLGLHNCFHSCAHIDQNISKLSK